MTNWKRKLHQEDDTGKEVDVANWSNEQVWFIFDFRYE
jgi:hypothetical protein